MRLIEAFHKIEPSTEKLRFLLILSFVFTLPFDYFYSSSIFFTLCIVTLVDIRRENIRRIPIQFWLFQGVFYLGLIGYLYSCHRPQAGFLLERQLAILLFPLILPLAIKIDENKVRMALVALSFTCVVASVYMFVNMFVAIRYELKLPLLKTIFSGAFFNHQFSKPLGIHAGYLSLYMALSSFYILQLLTQAASVFRKLFLSLVLLVLVTAMLFLASRNTIIASLFILIVVFPIFKVENKGRYYVIAAVICISVFLTIRNVPYFKDRFSIELISEIKPLKDGQLLNYNSTEPRIERWKGAASLISKSPWIGYGTGDEIEMLKTEYSKRGLFVSYLENFNAHNQYLSYLLKNGIVGLLFFAGVFLYYVFIGWKAKDFSYLTFLLLLLIGFYTENILDTNKGIFFFAFFNTLFGYQSLITLQVAKRDHVVKA